MVAIIITQAESFNRFEYDYTSVPSRRRNVTER